MALNGVDWVTLAQRYNNTTKQVTMNPYLQVGEVSQQEGFVNGGLDSVKYRDPNISGGTSITAPGGYIDAGRKLATWV